MEKIIIVESPSKSKTIETYMGGGYKVLSSKGHVRDLAISGKGGLGIDIENNFQPKYVNIKEKATLIKSLIKECKGKDVLIATDPDREGEAIGWHLAQILDIDLEKDNRIVFNEITKPAIQEAIKHPRKIDKDLVSSQETRRMLDRIIGFKLSKLLQKKIKSVSAGRVQSVALKLIVDLEKEIQAFVPEEYYDITAYFKGFEAILTKYKGEKVDIKTKVDADSFLALLKDQFVVSNIEKKVNARESKPAFITSTLQQEASTKLNMGSAKTMRVAQALYEGKKIKDETVGLITYMRTDSDRLSSLFVDDANKYINEWYGSDYLGHIKHKDVNMSQDAHEGIRPTSLERTPESLKAYLTSDELKLYKMIYARALASLMAPAKFETLKVDLVNNDLEFRANGSKEVFDGYLRVYGAYVDSKDTILPEMKVNDVLMAESVLANQHFTKAPARYTEAKLIKDMEELGIGRPSTYAQTMQTIMNRKYVNIEDKRFIPTEQGILTVNKLDEFFSEIINVKYTAMMENNLDEIANGKKSWVEFLKDFYFEFTPMVDNAMENMEAVIVPDVETGELCPHCGRPMVIKKGRYGEFEACSGYPECKYIKKEEPSEPLIKLDILCPKCKKGHFVQRVAKKGRSKGQTFFACDNYPKCKNIVNGVPTNEVCPICGEMLAIKDDQKICTNSECSSNKKNAKEKKD